MVMLDRLAVEALFDNTGGPDWKDKEGWGTDAALGDWGKVDVDAAGRVVTLLLQDNGLAGSTPSELEQLRGLQAMLGLHPSQNQPADRTAFAFRPTVDSGGRFPPVSKDVP